MRKRDKTQEEQIEKLEELIARAKAGEDVDLFVSFNTEELYGNLGIYGKPDVEWDSNDLVNLSTVSENVTTFINQKLRSEVRLEEE